MTAAKAVTSRWRYLARSAFLAYALALVIATHWPRLALPDMGVERPDIMVHLGVFGLWTMLLLATEYTGPNTRWTSIGLAWIIAVAYAAIDESTQALPGVHRTAAWDDFGANSLGVTLACLAWGIVIRPLLVRRDRLNERVTLP